MKNNTKICYCYQYQMHLPVRLISMQLQIPIRAPQHLTQISHNVEPVSAQLFINSTG